ncbi:MAG TPA: serine protease [Gemmataceae bacterium]|nr:serine protease [Gemmataceae bacterium]
MPVAIEAGRPAAKDPATLARIGRAGTAYVEVMLPGKRVGSGTAFCVDRNGLFVTNEHVVRTAARIQLVLNPTTAKQRVLPARVTRVDRAGDLAILQAEDSDAEPLALGPSADLTDLQPLVAFGFPFGRALATDGYPAVTVNSLKVSSLRRVGGELYRIQLDGALNPGHSGGPVLDEFGRVVGVVVGGIPGSGLCEAIPAAALKRFLAASDDAGAQVAAPPPPALPPEFRPKPAAPPAKRPAAPSPAVPAELPAPGALAGDRVEVRLPSIVERLCVGGAGRYIVLHLPKERKLAVFDATEGKVSRYLPAAEDSVLIAAGQDKLFVILPNASAIQRWDFRTGERDVTAPLALKNGTPAWMVMGSASRGPLLIVERGGIGRGGLVFLDPVTFRPADYDDDERRGGLRRFGPDDFGRASADGTVFTSWSPGTSPQGFTTLRLTGRTIRHQYDHVSVGHLTPSPDGKVVYTARGAFTPEAKALDGGDARGNREDYLIPSAHGNYYLRVPLGSRGGAGREQRGPATLHMAGDQRPLVTIPDLPVPANANPWDREKIGLDQRLHFIPSAKMLVALAPANDHLIVYKLDLDEALEKSGVDYLLVTSTPVGAARRGGEYVYQIQVKSKKGGVKYKLESGPPGMTVEGTGRLTWRVPAAGESEVQVLLTISDAVGQEIFHTFRIAVD